MTLNQWIKAGGCMLSDWTAGWCCKTRQLQTGKPCSIRMLREMELSDIFAISGGGDIATRELRSFAKRERMEGLLP